MRDRSNISILLFFFLTAFLVLFLLVYGEAGFGFDDKLVLWQLRFPKVVVALLAGGLLASSGLLLQVFFQNPLAGPDLLGINSGACLGVAFAIMGSVYLPESWQGLSRSLMSMAGALSLFFILAFLVHKNMSRISLLILGLLMASFTSSLISVLVNASESLQVKNFLVWSMGSFQGVSLEELPSFVFLSILGIVSVALLPKKLNQFILGENYAKSMGLNVHHFKIIIILICSLLVGVVTSYCGPIGFIGIIAPHVAKAIIRRSDIRTILPATFLVGSSLALTTELLLIFTARYAVSTNSLLGLIGAPVIALYLVKERRNL